MESGEEGDIVELCAVRQTNRSLAKIPNYSRDASGEEHFSTWQATRAALAVTPLNKSCVIRGGRQSQSYASGALGYNNSVNVVWNEVQDLWTPKGKLDPGLKCVVSTGAGKPAIKPVGDTIWALINTVKTLAEQTENTERVFAMYHRDLLYGYQRYFRFNVERGLQGVDVDDYKCQAKTRVATTSYMEDQQMSRNQFQDCASNLSCKQVPHPPRAPYRHAFSGAAPQMVFLGVSVLLISVSFLIYYKNPLRSSPTLRSGLQRLGWRGSVDREESQPPEIVVGDHKEQGDNGAPIEDASSPSETVAGTSKDEKEDVDRQAMPPPPTLNVRPSLPQASSPPQPRPQRLSTNSLAPPSRGPPKLKPLPPATASRPPSTPSLMPPPPRPSGAASRTSTTLSPSPSALRVPPGASGSTGASTSTLPPPSRPRQKVQLSPGHSPLDWARMQRDPSINLRNVAQDRLLRVSPAQLRSHNGRRRPRSQQLSSVDAIGGDRKDAWTVLSSGPGAIPKVYNVTPYLPFHPGGEPELMRAAGKDGTKLFMDIHPWVNWEGMLDGCLVGILVADGEGEGEGEQIKVQGPGEMSEEKASVWEEMD
ncbi:MAG: hypothetical protein M4579_005799 [Chaenotheca gracillima]|nr:MAG: hypothetical protein M4579_005799 [Chaenotheca gracillima]